MLRALIAILLLTISVNANADKIQKDNLFPKVTMVTSLGTITIELDRSRAPLTVDNFLHYVVDGHYDNTLFHRVEKEFVVQGGGYDNNYKARSERSPIVNESGNGMSNAYGTIAMARSNEPHSATNQLYFNLQDNDGLDPSSRRWGYAVFGEIVEGLEVLEQMASVQVAPHAELPGANVPIKPITLIEAKLMPEEQL